ncbi:hypothetical protein ScPMuIL_009657 [Solemya velum]
MLQCVGCKAFLSGELPKKVDADIYPESCKKLKQQLTEGHDKLCSWSSNPSPESFMFVPYYNREEILDDFAQRLNPLIDIGSQLPEISFQSLQKQELDENQYDEFLVQFYQSSIGSLCQTSCPAHSKKAIIMALCGWMVRDSAIKIIQCTYCKRQIGLWNFSKYDENTENDLTLAQAETVVPNVQHGVSQSNVDIPCSQSFLSGKISSQEKLIMKDNGTEEQQNGVVYCNGDHSEKDTDSKGENCINNTSIQNENCSDNVISEMPVISDGDDIRQQESDVNCGDSELVTTEPSDTVWENACIKDNVEMIEGGGDKSKTETDVCSNVKERIDETAVGDIVPCDKSQEDENCQTENPEGGMDTSEGTDGENIISISASNNQDEEVEKEVDETCCLEMTPCNGTVNTHIETVIMGDLPNEIFEMEGYIGAPTSLQIPNESNDSVDMETETATEDEKCKEIQEVSEICRTENVPADDNCDEMENKDNDGSSVCQRDQDESECDSAGDGNIDKVVPESRLCKDGKKIDNEKTQADEAVSSEIFPTKLTEKRPLELSCQEPVSKKRRVEEKEYFDPLAEHRIWCPWVNSPFKDTAEQISSQSASLFSPGSKLDIELKKKPGWKTFFHTMSPYHGGAIKQAPHLEGLRHIRKILKDWSSPESSKH